MTSTHPSCYVVSTILADTASQRKSKSCFFVLSRAESSSELIRPSPFCGPSISKVLGGQGTERDNNRWDISLRGGGEGKGGGRLTAGSRGGTGRLGRRGCGRCGCRTRCGQKRVQEQKPTLKTVEAFGQNVPLPPKDTQGLDHAAPRPSAFKSPCVGFFTKHSCFFLQPPLSHPFLFTEPFHDVSRGKRPLQRGLRNFFNVPPSLLQKKNFTKPHPGAIP